MSQPQARSFKVIIYGMIIVPFIFLVVLPISTEVGIVLYYEVLEYIHPYYDDRPSNVEFQTKHWYQAIAQDGVWERSVFDFDYQMISLILLPGVVLPVVIKYFTGSLSKLATLLSIVLVPIVVMLLVLIVIQFCSFTYFCEFTNILFTG